MTNTNSIKYPSTDSLEAYSHQIIKNSCLLILFLGSFIGICFWLFLHQEFRGLAITVGSLLFSIPLILLKANKTFTAVTFISWGLPIACIGVSVVDKFNTITSGSIQPVSFLDVRTLLVGIIILPAIITPLQPRITYVLNLFPSILFLSLFDPIHNYLGIGYDQWVGDGKLYYFSANLFALVTQIGLASGITLLKVFLLDSMKAASTKTKQYQTLFDAAQDPILVLDSKGDLVIEVNQKACELYGFSKEEFIGKRIESLTKDSERSQMLVAKFNDKGFLQNEPTLQFDSSGNELELEINASKIVLDHKHYVLSIQRDVKLRNEAIDRSFKLGSLLNKVAEVTELGIWEVDLKSHEVILSEKTKQFYELVSLTNPSLKSFLAFHPNDSILGSFNKLAQQSEAFDLEVELETSNSNLKWVRIIGIPNLQDNKITKWIGIMQDVTKVKRERELKEKVEAIAKVGEFQYNLKTKEIYWSEQLYKNAGLDSSSTISFQSFWDIVHPEDHHALSERIEEHLLNNKEEQIEFRLVLPNGETRTMLSTVDTEKDSNGKPYILYGATIDITQLRNSEANLKRSEELGRVGTWSINHVKNTSHWSDQELRNYGITMSDQDLTFDFFLQFVHPEDQEIIKTRYLDHIKPDETKKFKRLEYGTHFKIHGVDGVTRNLRTRTETAFDHNGNPIETFGISLDITELIQSQKLLEENEKLFESVVENIPHMIFLKDADDLSFKMFNKAGEDLLGVNRNDLYGKNDYDFFPMEQADFFTKADREILSKNKTELIEEEVIKTQHNGNRLLRTKKLPIHLNEKSYLLGISEDITELRKSQESKEEQRNQLSFVTEHATGGVWEWDITAKTFKWSPKAKLLLSTTKDGVPDSELDSFIHHDDVAVHYYQLKGALNDNEQYNVELRVKDRDADGEYRWVQSLGKVVRNKNGEPVKMLGIFIDIHEKKRIQDELLKINTFQKGILDSTSYIIMSADTNGVITSFNKGAELFTGYTAKEMIGKRNLNLISDLAEASEYAAIMRQKTGHKGALSAFDIVNYALRDKEIITLERNILSKDKVKKPVFLTLSKLKLQNEVVGYIGIARDITELRENQKKNSQYLTQIEQQLSEIASKNNELDQFAYAVSHDLKAPLRSISSLSHWIKEDLEEIPPEISANLDLLISRVKRMDGFINGLLEYSRIGRAERHAELIDFDTVLEDVVRTLRIPKSVVIKKESTFPTFKSHGIFIHQLFSNLISNAVKHNDKENGIIELSYAKKREQHQFIVSDNGPGIPDHLRERIFQIFQTIQNKDEKENTGIGLSIVKKVVDELKGTVEVDYAYKNYGAKFIITIPESE